MHDVTLSPLSPERFPDIPPIAGVEIATAASGLRYQGRDDLLLVHCVAGTTIAGAFTRSATRSAPVLDCQAKLAGSPEGTAAILVNAGNANAFTGRAGDGSVDAICHEVANQTGTSPKRVFTASTGVIGERLDHDRIIGMLAQLKGDLCPGNWEAAARAIATTDTFPKGAYKSVEIDGVPVSIAGIAKGSGMIAPDMATMLVFVFTDAAVEQDILQHLVSQANARSFNSITVDSDTSTSDSLLVAATGQASHQPIADQNSKSAREFGAALEAVFLDLAHQVVRDGEGATKFVEICVTGAADEADARKVAMAIANSPLVKTAIAGEDPNWGRIVMAVGKSGAQADRDRLSIRLGDILIAENGWVAPNYREENGASYMKRQEIKISVDLGIGTGKSVVWTCDLTHQYISINADYRS